MNRGSVKIKPVNNGYITVVQLTDPHICPANEQISGFDTAESLGSVIEMVNTEQDSPDLVLVTGDLVHQPASDVYLKLKTILQKSGSPVFCLPGNHDSPLMMEKVLNDDGISTCKIIECSNWKFILLDSVVEDSENGHLKESELEFLRGQLTGKIDSNLVICLHHQPVKIGSRWMDRMMVSNGNELMSLVRDVPNVKCILWGHIHQDFTAQLGNIRLFGSPSTCIQFKPNTQEFEKDTLPPGYRKFKFYSDGSISSTLHWLNISMEHDKVNW